MSEWCPLSEIADTNPETLPANTGRDYSFRYIDLGSVEAGHIDWHKVQFIRYGEAPSRARRRVAAGDVLFGTVRPNLQSHGYIDKTQKGELVASTGFSVVRARPAVSHGKYLFFALLGHDVYRQAVNAAVGSNYPAVNDSDVRRFKIFAPHVAEQKKIAQIFDTLDTQIRQTEALIAKLEQIKQGLLTDLLTRGIDENGQLRPPPEEAPHLYKDSPLGWVPREWDVRSLAEAAAKITDGTHQAVRTVEPAGCTVPFLYVSCIRNGRILWEQAAAIREKDFLDISRGRQPVQDMVLYTAVGSYGHAAVVRTEQPFAFQRHIACIYPAAGIATGAFVGNYLNSPLAKAHADRVALGNAQKTVTLRELARFSLPIPPLVEQERILGSMNRCDARIQKELVILEKLQFEKVGLMDDLLTGRVRVTPLLEQAEQAAS